jgi:uncharacterized surface protein with fasciclin (FAS1) repeats
MSHPINVECYKVYRATNDVVHIINKVLVPEKTKWAFA